MARSTRPADITIVAHASNDPARCPSPNPDSGAKLVVPGMGTVHVLSTNCVHVNVEPPFALPAFQQLTAGPALGLLLHSNGDSILHGSAVSISGKGVVILGAAGLGKSTLAAALRQKGHAHVSDGMCVIRMVEGSARLLPGPPFAKLWPDSLQSLGFDPAKVESVFPGDEKRLVPVTGPVARQAVPVHRIYSLAFEPSEPEPVVARVSPAVAVWELVRNYYLKTHIGVSQSSAIFDRCVELARKVSVSTLVRTNDICSVSGAASLVENDVLD